MTGMGMGLVLTLVEVYVVYKYNYKYMVHPGVYPTSTHYMIGVCKTVKNM